MKQKPTHTNPEMTQQADVCTQCGLCDPQANAKTKAVRGESKALYNAEVLSYYFYFYHQLVAGKNGLQVAMDEWL
jgi:hypothetical protein